MEHNYDFLGIGDITTDAFIKLKDPSAHIDIDKGAREICMRFADKIPYEDIFVVPAVGNAPNAAVAASRLGLRSALMKIMIASFMTLINQSGFIFLHWEKILWNFTMNLKNT